MDWDSLVSLVREGDRDAEEQFHRVLFPRLVRVAAGRNVPEMAREDLAQEAILAAFRQIQSGQFEERSSLATWLTSILHNVIAAYWRRQGRREEIESGFVATRPLALPAGQGSLDSMAVREGLGRLPAGMAELLRMRYYEDLSNEEIATRLHTKEGTVGQRLNKARSFLRRALLDADSPAQVSSPGRQKKLKDLSAGRNQQ